MPLSKKTTVTCVLSVRPNLCGRNSIRYPNGKIRIIAQNVNINEIIVFANGDCIVCPSIEKAIEIRIQPNTQNIIEIVRIVEIHL